MEQARKFKFTVDKECNASRRYRGEPKSPIHTIYVNRNSKLTQENVLYVAVSATEGDASDAG